MPEEHALSIGEVIGVLRDEFPDVSVSKVRFLESQGLLSPGRSDGGYRQFGPTDLERLRFILRQQRDHFLPLKVIKSKLTLWERGEEPTPGASPPVRHEFLHPPGEPTLAGELQRRSGLDDAQLAALVEHGLLQPNEDGVYGPGSLAVAREAQRLFELGFEARHLAVVRHAAAREADVLRQLALPHLLASSPDSNQQAERTLAAGGDAMAALHRLLLAGELRALTT
jgi:DNA-binding transcriptional MerR regulator